MPETCQELSSPGTFMVRTCGRKLSGSEDYPDLCGMHASAKRRAKPKGQQREDLRERRQAELLEANGKLVALNAKLGIQSTLQTTMPTTGPGAFIGMATGHAIVRIDQLEWLADQIAEAMELVGELQDQIQHGDSALA